MPQHVLGVRIGVFQTSLGKLNNLPCAYRYVSGLPLSEQRRLKDLEAENASLKRLLADAMLDNAGLKGLLAKNS